MKTKILFICCFILLLCGCSKEKEVEEELLTDNDFGFSILLDDGLALDKGLQIKSINDYIGDEYEEAKKNNNTIYSNKNIQIILDKNNKIKKVVLFTDYYQVLGNIRVGDNKDTLDYPNNKVTPTKYIASSEKKTVKMTYLLSNNKITKIMLS